MFRARIKKHVPHRLFLRIIHPHYSMHSEDDMSVTDLLATEAAIDKESRDDAFSATDFEQAYDEDMEIDGEAAKHDACYSAIEDDALDNSNNNSRTFKWTPIETVQKNTVRDGYTYVFISPAEGPMLSAKAKEQVMVLNYLLETPPHKKRIVSTSSLVATFNSDQHLETLVEKIILDTNEIAIMRGGREDIGTMRVDCIPLNMVSLPA